MIEGPKPAADVTKPASAPSIRRLTDAIHDFGSRLSRLALPTQRDADAFLWNLRLAYRLMWVALTGLGAYVVVDLMVIQPKPKLTHAKVLSAKKPAVVPALPATTSGETLNSLSDYLAALTPRNPFTGDAGGGDRPAVKQTTKVHLQELAGDLTIVGIERGQNPVALMESASQKRTYMVKVGDEINGIAVKKISAEGVLLSYEGEELLLQ